GAALAIGVRAETLLLTGRSTGSRFDHPARPAEYWTLGVLPVARRVGAEAPRREETARLAGDRVELDRPGVRVCDERGRPRSVRRTMIGEPRPVREETRVPRHRPAVRTPVVLGPRPAVSVGIVGAVGRRSRHLGGGEVHLGRGALETLDLALVARVASLPP